MTTLIRPRAEWGSTFNYAARQLAKPASRVKLGCYLHHSVTLAPDLVAATLADRQDEHAAMRLLERIGTDRFGSGVSYNVAVMPSGEAYAGQPLTSKATHSDYGRDNYTHASIVLVGNYSKAKPTYRQRVKVALILVAWRKDGTIPKLALIPHSARKATACPGEYARAAILGMVTRARLLYAVTPPPPVWPDYRQGRQVYASKMRQGQRNSDSVWNLRLALAKRGYKVKPGNDYGDATVAAVKAFQLAQGWRGRDADGIAGPGTVAKLGLKWVAG